MTSEILDAAILWLAALLLAIGVVLLTLTAWQWYWEGRR